MIKKFVCAFLLLINVACGSRSNSECSNSDYKDFLITPTNSSLSLPVAYALIDTTVIVPSDIFYNRRLSGKDSNSTIIILVSDTSRYHSRDLNRAIAKEKQDLAASLENASIISDEIRMINNYRIGYVKFLTEKHSVAKYIGTIMFLKGANLVTIMMTEGVNSNRKGQNSQIDCILSRIRP